MLESEDVRIEIPGNHPTNNINVGVVREWEFCIQGHEITQTSERKRQIEKVPPLLLKGEKGRRNGEYYEPTVVSLGPYHHNSDHLSAAENYKLITLEEYCLSCEKRMDTLYNKVFEVVEDARNCYIDGCTDEFTDEQFNRMMLHDGCFILFFIESVATGNNKLMLYHEHLGALGIATVARDMLLLENQIPFVVLKVLLNLKFPEDGGESILNKFFHYLSYGEITKREEKVFGKKQPLHLLELYRSYFISLFSSSGSIKHSMWRQWLVKITQVDADREDLNYVKKNRLFDSVTELKAKGIFVKGTSDNVSFNEDIQFHSRFCYGELQLVRRVVYGNSKAIYLNMIAYEMCAHNPNDFRVSTHVRVMQSLVIHDEDVKELRNNNVLIHSLGGDEEVVKMYKDIDAPAINLYRISQLQRGIEKHCNNKYKTWAAELINVYFSSPWQTVALLVATAILFTTFLQTYFTVRPLPDESSGDIVKLLQRCVNSKHPPPA